MSTCSIQDSNTKEPKIFYKSDSGEVFSSLYDVLNNSSQSYETGVKNQAEDFVTMISTPIFDKSSMEGQIQDHIKNGYLTGQQVAPNTFRATDEYAAEILNADLLVNKYKQFRRNGLDFEFGNFKAEVGEKSPFFAMIDAGKNYLSRKNPSREPKPVSYTKEDLSQMIQNFMKKMGFSITSIESYKKNYKTKFGIEPDAGALIDFNNQIIALSKGEISLDELSEEFSHFIVEAWNQDDINKMLPYVNNTQEYLENAERYREVYSKQVKDPARLEEAVRREVLGRILANSLQKDFTTENRSEMEKNIIQKLMDILRDFMNFVTGRVNPDVEAEIDMMAQEIQNMLYNENLENVLDTDNMSPILSVMYSLDARGIKNLKSKLGKIGQVNNYSSELERQVDELFNTSHSAAIIANERLKSNPGIQDHAFDIAYGTIMDTEELLTDLKAIFKNTNFSNHDPSVKKSALAFRKHILEKAEATLTEMSDLRGNYEYITKKDNRESAFDLLDKYTGLSDEKKTEIVDDHVLGVEALQVDTTAFIRVFGHVGKTSNLFVGILSKIIENLQGAKVIEFEKDFDNLLSPLIPYKDRLINFVKNGTFRSGVNNEKMYQDERSYELSILADVYSDVFKDMTLEDYIERFQEKGKLPIDKTELSYFEYKYKYDLGLPNQKWLRPKSREYKVKYNKMIQDMNFGQTPWLVEYYQHLVNRSENRSKDKSALQRDREMSNPYYEDGTLKTGFTPMLYRDAKSEFLSNNLKKSELVSPNTRHTLLEGDNEPGNSELVFLYRAPQSVTGKDKEPITDGANAYHAMKWNSNRVGDGSQESIREQEQQKIETQENFITEYKAQIKNMKRKGLSGEELNTALREWVNGSLLFEPSEAYWDKFEPSDIRFEEFYQGVKSKKDIDAMEVLENQYRNLQLRKRLALKKFKNQSDYKEIDVQSMGTTTKSNINNIEVELSQIRKQIEAKFEAKNMGNIYIEASSEGSTRLNTSFHEIFLDTMQVPFEDASMKEIERFFANPDNMEGNKYYTYQTLKNLIDNGSKSAFVQRFEQVAKTNGYGEGKDATLKAYLVSNAPSWYKRHDSNARYDNFIRDYNSGKVNIESLIENYMADPNLSEIQYQTMDNSINEKIEMKLTPSFRYTLPPEPNINDLKEQYDELSNENPAELRQKFEILQQMGGALDADASYREDISDILNDPENLKGYILMMDAQMKRLTREGMLKKHFVYLAPQVRQTGFDRLDSFFKNGNKKGQALDYAKEIFSFRADDHEESYKSLKIPHYGYYKLKPDELTTDIYYAMSWGLSNANHYEQRLLHWQDASDAIKGLEAQEFERGKRSTDTNYHKMTKEMMDFNFYGKTVTSKIEFKVPGMAKPIDLSKTLFGLKSFSIVSALAFSPVVAATNFSSGLLQNAMLSLTGRAIFSPSNTRAAGMMAKLTGESMQDIGRFDPQAKINKIMYGFGVYDLAERMSDAKFGKAKRLLPEAGFSMMALTNFPLEAQSTLVKLMEYRLVDGKFLSWRQYSLEEKAKNSSLTDKDMKATFETFSKKSMFDYIKDDGKFDTEQLDKDGYKGDLTKDRIQVMSAIRTIAEQTTMEIAKHHEGSGGRNPAWSFILSLKKWLVMATSSMTSRERFELESGGREEGLIYTPRYIYDIFKGMYKDKQKFSEAYDSLSESARKNVKTSMVLTGIMGVMLGLAIVLKKAADDDDEEDNYLVQLSAYMAMRTLNEAFSGHVGIGDAYFDAVQNPIMVGATIKNMANVVKFGDIGQEVASGKYKGHDKYWVGIMKATYLKNPYTISSAEVLGQTRQSYEHFNTEDSLYHIFDLVPAKPKDGEE